MDRVGDEVGPPLEKARAAMVLHDPRTRTLAQVISAVLAESARAEHQQHEGPAIAARVALINWLLLGMYYNLRFSDCWASLA